MLHKQKLNSGHSSIICFSQHVQTIHFNSFALLCRCLVFPRLSSRMFLPYRSVLFSLTSPPVPVVRCTRSASFLYRSIVTYRRIAHHPSTITAFSTRPRLIEGRSGDCGENHDSIQASTHISEYVDMAEYNDPSPNSLGVLMCSSK